MRESVEVYPEDGMARDTARALLDAAERLGHRPEVVEAIFNGFRVPGDVADATIWPTHPTYTGRSTAPTPAAAVALGALRIWPTPATDAGS